MLTRRHFIMTAAAMAATPVFGQDDVGFDDTVVRRPAQGPNPWGLHERFMPTVVQARAGLNPGDLHVDPVARYLYLIREDGQTALRYGVAVGRSGLQSPGTYTIRRKVEWPNWRPTDAMIAREPEIYAQYADGVEGGPDNPLGARALYLYDGNRDTYLRIHGTPQPWSIGTSASSGCVRMVNEHVIDLYPRVPMGTRVTLHAPA
ncbi:L,D-transpeptidase [Rhodophyticola porphyridii]|uniref:L,D-transpeptidase n=1 Tax=Rhodophyticola porphyridii TaxID=1852017 RepID=A0A3L9Y194_9RHOB|nr:L,D-transpeptidase [Rhodophyticola porphyridii]RMA42604.1 L,D-transpeptidase [Rhodophyticola porphyridii]